MKPARNRGGSAETSAGWSIRSPMPGAKSKCVLTAAQAKTMVAARERKRRKTKRVARWQNEKAERMTTAPAMPDFAKTINAVVIRSSVLFERPALNLNKTKPSVNRKINANSCCIRQAVAVEYGQTVRHKQAHWEKTKMKLRYYKNNMPVPKPLRHLSDAELGRETYIIERPADGNPNACRSDKNERMADFEHMRSRVRGEDAANAAGL